MSAINQDAAQVTLPRIAIEFCTQCKWMLRAAYYAQELLSTFDGVLGEVALVPTTGGTFRVKLVRLAVLYPAYFDASLFLTIGKIKKTSAAVSGTENESAPGAMTTILLWDRKLEGGFPETKVLKQRVRDHVQPERNLGHSDKTVDTATAS